MANAKKCDISGQLYDIIDESKREFHIYRKPPGKGKHKQLLELCPEKYAELLKVLKQEPIPKPAPVLVTRTKTAKATKAKPQMKARKKYNTSKVSKRTTFVCKRAARLIKKEGMERKGAMRQASDEYKSGNRLLKGPKETYVFPEKTKPKQNGSSKCKSCSEHIPSGDTYCPTCNMVHGEEVEV